LPIDHQQNGSKHRREAQQHSAKITPRSSMMMEVSLRREQEKILKLKVAHTVREHFIG
jgi:hypothetical protein